MMNSLSAVLAASLALLPFAVDAQTYRCIGKDGKKYYQQSLPAACAGQPIEQLDAQGRVVKRIDAPSSAPEREKSQADADDRKREAAAKEEGRRNRAVLATYANEAEIDQARSRALKDNVAAIKSIEERMSGLKLRQDQLAKELGAKGGQAKAPPKLAEDMRNAEFDMKTQQELMAVKKKEADQINARYDEDKKRYQGLASLDAKERANKTGEAKGAAK